VVLLHYQVSPADGHAPRGLSVIPSSLVVAGMVRYDKVFAVGEINQRGDRGGPA